MDRSLGRRLVRRLEAAMPARLRRFRVALLPDFFIDHFVEFDSWPAARLRMAQIVAQGGGGYPGVRQRILHGGNAANAAIALARLGPTVHLLAQTDRVGLAVLGAFARGARLDISRVRLGASAAITGALEFAREGANVLVSHAGPVESFGPDALSESDWRLLESCDAVGVVNWALNRRAGTALAASVFGRVKAAGGFTFFDSADPSARRGDLPALWRRVLGAGRLDAWGLNENELRQFAASRGAATKGASLSQLIAELRRATAARLDLHTRRTAITTEATGSYVAVRAPSIGRRRRSTGAGDAWNAGNLLGQLLELPPDERLLLAHAVAGFYVSAAEPCHPSLREVRMFLRARA